MGYLTELEISSYTKIPGITLTDVNTASALIDAYKGKSFSAKEYVNEFVKLSKKRQYGHEMYKGKLLHFPRVTISSVAADTSSYFGSITQTFDTACLQFDNDDSEYFTFIPQANTIYNPFPYKIPNVIKVTYKAGYEVIPEPLKIATGMICDNAKQSGGFRNFKSRTDFDMTIAFSDKEDPVMSSNVISLINSVRLI